VLAYFKFDYHWQSGKWVELDLAEQKEGCEGWKDWREECVKSEKIVNKGNRKKGFRATASDIFWFIDSSVTFYHLFRINFMDNFLRQFLCFKDHGSKVFGQSYSVFTFFFWPLIDSWMKFFYSWFGQSICVQTHSYWIFRARFYLRTVIKNPSASWACSLVYLLTSLTNSFPLSFLVSFHHGDGLLNARMLQNYLLRTCASFSCIDLW
jgi:hypothetical protein